MLRLYRWTSKSGIRKGVVRATDLENQQTRTMIWQGALLKTFMEEPLVAQAHRWEADRIVSEADGETLLARAMG